MSGHAPIHPDLSSPDLEIRMRGSQPWIKVAHQVRAGGGQSFVPAARFANRVSTYLHLAGITVVDLRSYSCHTL
jgi:hypothetical protein